MSDETTNWYADDKATFGDRLAAAREASGLTQGEMAKRIGVKTTTYDAWEHDSKEPRANRLTIMSGMLGVSLRWLLTGEGEGPDIDDDGTQADTKALLLQMRDLRTTITKAGVTMGHLEKRLRQVMKDQ